jgi:hypothetical protein
LKKKRYCSTGKTLKQNRNSNFNTEAYGIQRRTLKDLLLKKNAAFLVIQPFGFSFNI